MKHLLGLLIVVILCAGCKSSLNNAEPLATPVVTDFSPKSGPIGEIVTLYGTNFPSDTALFTLLVGNAKVKVLSATPDSVQFMIPDTATSNLVILKFNGKEILTKDSLKIVNGLTFYPKVAHVGDTIEVHCRPALTGDNIILSSSYFIENYIKCTKVGPATWIFAAPGGEPKRRLYWSMDLFSKDYLVMIPPDQTVDLVSMTINNLSSHTFGTNYQLPLRTVINKFARWDTTRGLTLSYSNWVSQCDDPTSFCMNTHTYYNGHVIAGNIKLDTTLSVIKSITFYNRNTNHDLGYERAIDQTISLVNIPYQMKGDTIVSEIKGKEVSSYLTTFKLGYSQSTQGLSGYGSSTESSTDSVEVLDNTSISISILR